VLRKERAIGVYPGGYEMSAQVPVGHGSKKLKREALDELVLRVTEALRMHQPRITLPYCVFNGGTDAWLDIGNKSVGVAALQAYFNIPQAHCLHVGDQVRRRDAC
jgi:IMP and pyridine-specific 5'-nucleotidase